MKNWIKAGWERKYQLILSLNRKKHYNCKKRNFWKLGEWVVWKCKSRKTRSSCERVKRGGKLIFSAVRFSNLTESSSGAELPAPAAVNVSHILLLAVWSVLLSALVELSFLCPLTVITWRASNPDLSRIVTVVARMEWFVWIRDRFASFDIRLNMSPNGRSLTTMLSYQTMASELTSFLGRWNKNSFFRV